MPDPKCTRGLTLADPDTQTVDFMAENSFSRIFTKPNTPAEKAQRKEAMVLCLAGQFGLIGVLLVCLLLKLGDEWKTHLLVISIAFITVWLWGTIRMLRALPTWQARLVFALSNAFGFCFWIWCACQAFRPAA
jgi:hypothetical protein